MRTKTRKVTVDQVVYIANDGAEFTDEYDCEAYEIRLIGKGLKMRTCKYNDTDSVDICWYVELNNLDQINDFIKLCKFEGVTTNGVTTEPGIYMYTDGRLGASWINLTKIVDIFNGGKS